MGVKELTFTPSDFLFSKVLHAEKKGEMIVRIGHSLGSNCPSKWTVVEITQSAGQN